MTLETEKSLCLWKAHEIKEAPIGILVLQIAKSATTIFKLGHNGSKQASMCHNNFVTPMLIRMSLDCHCRSYKLSPPAARELLTDRR
jgi:hypothetical protein